MWIIYKTHMDPQPSFNWDKDTWKVMDAYFKQDKILVDHQLKSFDNFVDYIIPQLIEKNNPVRVTKDYDATFRQFKTEYEIKFGQTYMSKPLIHENTDVIKRLYPNEARLRGLTYSAPVFIDIHITKKVLDPKTGIMKIDGATTVEERIPFLKLPVMLHSKYCHLSENTDKSLAELGECPYDHGGYFIVNGNEKVLVSQERVAENKVFCWKPPKSPTTKYTHEAEIKTCVDQRFYPVRTNKVMLTKEPTAKAIKGDKEKGLIYGRKLAVKIPNFKEDIPLFIVFRALGIASEKEMFEMILPDMDNLGSNYTNFLIPSIDEARHIEITMVVNGEEITETISTQEHALRYLTSKLNLSFNQKLMDSDPNAKVEYVKSVLAHDLFPHVGQKMTDSRKKAFFLGHMTRKLIACYFGVRPYDDRDHYGNKRVNLAGPLLTELFRTHFIKLIHDIRKSVSLHMDGGKSSQTNLSLRKIIQGCNIDAKLKFALSTGDWRTQKSTMSSTKKGIAQVLNRLSFAGALSHKRRIQSPLEKTASKSPSPRYLNDTHYGMCCPNESPEGQSIGITKNLALQTHVTIQTSDMPIRIILSKLGVSNLSDISTKSLVQCTKIFVNGDWFGIIHEKDTHKLYTRLKILKRHGVIVPYISIAWFVDWHEIQIQTDGGRYTRPLYVVNDGMSERNGHFDGLDVSKCGLAIEGFKLTEDVDWSQLLVGLHQPAQATGATPFNGGVIEYLDTNEIETAMIAMTYADILANRSQNKTFVRYTHCEIHPMMMMGVVSAMIPFSDHNPSPRNCYQSSMAKQSIGIYVTNYNSRMDTLAHVAVYGQQPLVTTRMGRYTMMDQLPHGTTSMLLYACFTGFNQEDAIIINRDSVERGFFNTLFFRSYIDKAQKHRSASTATEKFMKPNKKLTSDIKNGSYDAIGDDGRPILNKTVNNGDVIIAKVIEMKEREQRDFIYKDASTVMRENEPGIIDKIIPDREGTVAGYNADGHPFIKIRLTTLRPPEIGDKFASRYSQKGTVGMLFRSIDMPMTASGLYPDMIFNPHGIPTRMTVGKILETLLGKIAVASGLVQDATPFVKFDLNNFKDQLKRYGIDEFGYEVMYNGQTGQMIPAVLFYGPTYYQRLKHMVRDKLHSREAGPVQLLTRQPAEGRSRNGGLRIGEMERDVFIAHGIPKFLKERMMDSSDLFKVYVSKKAETIIVANEEMKLYKYNGQHLSDDEVLQIQLPYAMKLLLQELECMGVDTRLHVQ
jgi:DNA-directed RNA polymerase II subunit RPB2